MIGKRIGSEMNVGNVEILVMAVEEGAVVLLLKVVYLRYGHKMAGRQR